ncbi:WD40-repeat-containing domain protein [Fennellomyces sp. T-0311]|nr:WD40-repeat-containing domain protein [Fennellomyces sp. T-0311]
MLHFSCFNCRTIGLAVKCNPATGTVDRHILYSTDDGIPIRVNAVQVEGQRILWGFNPGYITMTTRPKSVVGRQLRVFADFHQGGVTALALPSFVPDIVLSAGEDGTVKIWDVPSLSCVSSIVGISGAATCLELTRDYRIVAGYTSGAIVIWNIRVDHLVKEFRDQLRGRDMGQRTTSPSSTNILDSRRIIEPITADTSCPVQAIKHDGDVILVTYAGSSEIYKYNMNGERLGVYGCGHDTGTISCMEWDTAQVAEDVSLQAAMKLRTKMTEDASLVYRSSTKSATPTRTTRILVTGDTAGTICVWDGDATNIDEHRIRPLRVLHGHISPISALYVDACKIVSGSDDGWIRIWDPLSGVLVNVLGNKIPKSAPIDRNDVSVMRVTSIQCDDYRGIATIGHQVKTWDFSPNKQMLNKRNLRKNVRAGAGEARKLHYEIKQEWKESAETMQQERKEREREAKELSKMTLGGLSDEEMLAYAMMLSQEQSGEVSPQDIPISKADYVDENDEELMMAMIASLETASIQNGSTSSSSSDDTLAEWPAVGQQSQKSNAGTIWNDTQARVNDDEDDEELQYVLKMSEKEF